MLIGVGMRNPVALMLSVVEYGVVGPESGGVSGRSIVDINWGFLSLFRAKQDKVDAKRFGRMFGGGKTVGGEVPGCAHFHYGRVWI